MILELQTSTVLLQMLSAFAFFLLLVPYVSSRAPGGVLLSLELGVLQLLCYSGKVSFCTQFISSLSAFDF